jgi:hypothetical protein
MPDIQKTNWMSGFLCFTSAFRVVEFKLLPVVEE